MKRLAGDCGGSFLMEYLVVCAMLAVPLMLLLHKQFFDVSTGEYVGEIGLGLQSMFQRVLGGIALPIP